MTLKMFYITERTVCVYCERMAVCVDVGLLCNDAAFVGSGDLADKFRAAGDWELSLWVAQLE